MGQVWSAKVVQDRVVPAQAWDAPDAMVEPHMLVSDENRTTLRGDAPFPAFGVERCVTSVPRLGIADDADRSAEATLEVRVITALAATRAGGSSATTAAPIMRQPAISMGVLRYAGKSSSYLFLRSWTLPSRK